MGMNMAGSAGGGGRRRHRRKPVMADINVTPMVDVMLVLLIIFMVSAPLLTVGVPLDLPQTQAKSLEQDKTPLQLSVDTRGKVFINDTEVAMADLIPKLKAITDARGGMDERRYMRADKKADYGTVARVMGQLSGAGFKRLGLVTEVEQGSEAGEAEGRQDTGGVDCPARHRDRVGTGVVFDQGVRVEARRIRDRGRRFRECTCQGRCENRQEGKPEAAGGQGR